MTTEEEEMEKGEVVVFIEYFILRNYSIEY